MVNSVGSGLDVQALVDGLMQAQNRGLNQLNNNKNILTYQQTAYSQLKDSLNSFETNISNLATLLNKKIYKVSSGDEAIASAVTSSGSVAPGLYDLNITQLAKAQQLSSAGFSAKDVALSISGDLTITVNGNQLTLAVDASNTLEQLRDYINNSNNNPGVTASILNVSDGLGGNEYRLMLSANETGLNHTITMGGTALGGLGLTNQISAAQNAQFTLNGFPVERGSNLISDVLDGVSFHLNGQLGATQITIESDIDNEETAIHTAINSMIDSYNNIVETLSKNQGLKNLRDNTYSLIQLSLKRTMDASFANGGINTLLDLGIKLDSPKTETNEDGVEYVVGNRITIDSDALSKSIRGNIDGVRSLFNDTTNGVIKRLETTISDIEDKTIFNRDQMINQQKNYFDRQINNEETRLSEIRQRLVSKYSALDTFLARYSQISSFLEQQLDALSPRSKK